MDWVISSIFQDEIKFKTFFVLMVFNFFTWLSHNISWNFRHIRQYFFHVWQIPKSQRNWCIPPLRFTHILPTCTSSSHSFTGLFVVILKSVGLLIGQFEFAANSAAQLSLDENEGDSWICEEQVLNRVTNSVRICAHWCAF